MRADNAWNFLTEVFYTVNRIGEKRFSYYTSVSASTPVEKSYFGIVNSYYDSLALYKSAVARIKSDYSLLSGQVITAEWMHNVVSGLMKFNSTCEKYWDAGLRNKIVNKTAIAATKFAQANLFPNCYAMFWFLNDWEKKTLNSHPDWFFGRDEYGIFGITRYLYKRVSYLKENNPDILSGLVHDSSGTVSLYYYADPDEAGITYATDPDGAGPTKMLAGNIFRYSSTRNIQVNQTPKTGYAFDSFSDSNISVNTQFKIDKTMYITARYKEAVETLSVKMSMVIKKNEPEDTFCELTSISDLCAMSADYGIIVPTSFDSDWYAQYVEMTANAAGNIFIYNPAYDEVLSNITDLS